MAAATGAVSATVRYIDARWRDRTEAPRIGSRESRRAATSFQPVQVHDARPRLAASDLGLDRNGFTLTAHRSRVSEFSDSPQLMQRYYPEMIELLCRTTGASRAFVASHQIRTEKPVGFNDAYARFVHCDYHISRAPEMARKLLDRHGVTPEPHWRFAWYNTWQPFDHEARRNPLAVIDWESLPLEDVIDYYYTGYDRDSLVAAPVYNPEHRWHYFPSMSTGEVLVMKQLESRPGRAVYCPHTSFDDPSAPDDAPPRRSIETRLMAVFEDDA